MIYFKVDILRRFPKEDKVLGHANGEYVSDGRICFDRMGKGEIIKNAPVFDFFHLESFGPKKDWEWRLQDVHGFIGVGSINIGWYISEYCKQVFEQFHIAPKYHFYATKLLYKGKKLDYWIFQFPINPLYNCAFEKSTFYFENENTETNITIKSEEEYLLKRRELLLNCNIKLKCSKISFKDNYDCIYNLPCGETLVSEKLKVAIETSKLEGFLFSEPNCEVETP